MFWSFCIGYRMSVTSCSNQSDSIAQIDRHLGTRGKRTVFTMGRRSRYTVTDIERFIATRSSWQAFNKAIDDIADWLIVFSQCYKTFMTSSLCVFRERGHFTFKYIFISNHCFSAAWFYILSWCSDLCYHYTSIFHLSKVFKGCCWFLLQ